MDTAKLKEKMQHVNPRLLNGFMADRVAGLITIVQAHNEAVAANERLVKSAYPGQFRVGLGGRKRGGRREGCPDPDRLPLGRGGLG